MKPANLILDLLRTYRHTGTSVKTIMSTGSMFGFSENLMRVSLSRLVARNTVEIVKRGSYRLAETTDPLNDFVEQWRLGEKRVRPWKKGEWICIHTPEPLTEKAIWALNNNGLRPVSADLWIRPDNLRLKGIELNQSLRALGLPDSTILMGAATLASHLQQRWLDYFDRDALNQAYIHTVERLGTSMLNLELMPVSAAKKESFNLGGHAIALLVKDPLMPSCFQNPETRQQLWQTMLLYDEAGRSVWADGDSVRGSSANTPNVIPTPSLATQYTR